ncbi:MAG: NifB/NifX family molybdenum-iron cluster-binding protein, partial [Candidatus Bathyarchaeia archaeon]
AIASDDQIKIAPHFGRTKGFVVFEVENGEVKSKEYRKNTFTGHARGLEGNHHADHHKAILEALSDCQVVISNGMGRRIYDDLKGANIKAFITEETEVERALSLYLQRKLTDRPELSCHHKHHDDCHH